MDGFLGYRCSLCGEEYAPDQVQYVCPKHGDSGNLDVVLDYDLIRREESPKSLSASSDSSIWRYLPLLPVPDPDFEDTPLHSVGGTPLYLAPRLGSQLGLRHLWLKDDGRNPTASFKDRASAVVVAHALEIRAKTVVTASTGNAGAALAGMAAAVGLPAVILAPATAPPAKVAQLRMYGAKVILVNGTYDQAFDLALAASREFGWYCRNTGYNPFTLEGKKTAAFEICEQLTLTQNPKSQYPNPNSPDRRSAGRGGQIRNPKSNIQNPRYWSIPDQIFVSVGDGNIISGIHKGLKDLLALGWIEWMPKLMGVQAEGSAAVYNAWASGTETLLPVHSTTIADSISVDLPRDGVRAVRAARETGGAYLTVSDEEILGAMKALATGAAIFVEPAAATAYAGLVKAILAGQLGADEHVVVMLTGSGLKDVGAAMKAAEEAVTVEPKLEAIRAIVKVGRGREVE